MSNVSDQKVGASGSANPAQTPTQGVPSRKKMKPKKDPLVPILGILVAGTIIAILGLFVGALVLGYFGSSRGPQTRTELVLARSEGAWKNRKSDIAVWAPYIDALIDAKQYTKAQEIINQGLVKFKDTDTYDYFIPSSQAFLYFAKKDYQGAINQANKIQDLQTKAYKKMLNSKVNPNRAKSYGIAEKYYDLSLLKIGAYEKLNKLDDAIATAKKYLETKTNESGVWYDLGNLYLKQKKTDLAKQAFDNALKYDPENEMYLSARKKLGD